MGIVSSECHDLMSIRNMIFCTEVVISNQIKKINEHQGKASAFYGCFEHLRVLSPEISETTECMTMELILDFKIHMEAQKILTQLI